MRAYTQAMGEAFERQVQRYFSDDVLVVAGAPAGLPGSKQDVYSYGLLALLTTAVQYPFATFELLTDSAYYFDYDTSGPQDVLEHSGYRLSYSVRARGSGYRRGVCGVCVCVCREQRASFKMWQLLTEP